MGTFTETIRTQKQKDFWRDSEKFQRFSPEIPPPSVEDLLSTAPPGTFDDAEDCETSMPPSTITSEHRHFKMMCNVIGKKGTRSTRDSSISKAIVEACAKDKIHITHAFGEDGEVWRCYNEAKEIQPGDVGHMYYGDLSKNNSKHYVGTVCSTYEKMSKNDLDQLPHVKEVWSASYKYGIFCRVDWHISPLSETDEEILKHPDKNGYRVQGTILRVC